MATDNDAIWPSHKEVHRLMTTGSIQISNEKYHSDDAISASMQKTMVKHGPKAYWNSFLNPERPEHKPTSAMLLGTLTHCAGS